MVFLWFFHSNLHFPMVFLWFSYGFPIVFLWFSYGFPMVFPFKPPFSYGFPMVFLWFFHSNLHFPMVFLWFSYGLPGRVVPIFRKPPHRWTKAPKAPRLGRTVAGGRELFLHRGQRRGARTTWLYSEVALKNIRNHGVKPHIMMG